MDIRVAIVSTAFPGRTRGFYPGIERVSEGIVDGLANKGVDVHVFTSKRMIGSEKEVRPSGARVTRVSSMMQYRGSGLLAIGQLDFCFSVYRKHLKDLRQFDVIQIISTSFIPSNILGRKPKTYAYFPHVDFPESFQDFLYLPAVNKITDLILKKSNFVIAGIPEGSPEVDVLTNKFGIPLEKIRYVHEGFDPERFKDIQADDLIQKYGNNMVLFVGPLIKRKGIEYLLRAMKLVLEQVPTAQLVIIGSIHGYGKNMIELAEILQISKNVHFLGFISDDVLPKYYSAAKVFAFPSLLEGYPLVILEAMGSGTPVIATNLTPICKQLESTGITFKPGDYKSMAKGIARLLQDTSYHSVLSNLTRKRALERFTWSNVADVLLKIYNEPL